MSAKLLNWDEIMSIHALIGLSTSTINYLSDAALGLVSRDSLYTQLKSIELRLRTRNA